MKFLGHLVCPVCGHDSWVVNFIEDHTNNLNIDVSCDRCGIHCIMNKYPDGGYGFLPQDIDGKKEIWEKYFK